MTAAELAKILADHKSWIKGEGGRLADLKGADLGNADLGNADLKGAYLKGADLSNAYLSNADLRNADLRGADLSGAYLSGANLSNANLSNANLCRAYLSNAYLSNAYLSNANLGGANLGGAKVPVIANIHRTVYAAASQPGAIEMGSWHTCETTHCQAGWVVALAGESGRKLEEKVGTSVAAALIYHASDPTMEKVPNFYTTSENALATMKRLAEQEAARESTVTP